MRILVVDDHEGLRHSLRRMLRRVPGVEVVEAESYEAALRALVEAFDLLLLDICLGPAREDRGGLRLLSELRRLGRDIPAVMVTGSEAMDDLREAMRLGARDYVLKDELSSDVVSSLVAEMRERLLAERADEPGSARRDGGAAIVGPSLAMTRVRKQIARVAGSDVPVLVLGATGTGKEMVARAIHDASERRDRPFVAVNCAAIPSNLLESILFGHERGAFTGADRKTAGRFAVAGAGTILLDEIGDMPLDLQSKLLRVLEEERFLPVGAEHEVPLHARVLAATNVDLEARVADGRFRTDLYYRLDVVSIRLPTLAERPEDVEPLARAFASALPRKLRFTPSALAWLARRPWPGNVRELKNVIRRLSVMADDDVVDVPTLEDLVPSNDTAGLRGSLERLVDAVLAAPDDAGSRQALLDRMLVERAVARCSGTKSAAARLVGIPRKVFVRRWERLENGAADVVDEGEEA